MVLLVLDTSVILKWFKEEVYTEVALRIKEEFVKDIHEIVVPDLLLYELTNAMRYDKKFDSEMIKSSIRNIVDMEIDITLPTEDLIFTALDISKRHDITIYDAIYVALASKVDGLFITADDKLYEKIESLEFVKFIRDFK